MINLCVSAMLFIENQAVLVVNNFKYYVLRYFTPERRHHQPLNLHLSYNYCRPKQGII
jgi:hypothetical protein